jgi:hypothetical protein
MKIDHLLDDVRDHEADLARQLRTIAERHAAEHDVYHTGHSQAHACGQRIEQLGPHARRYGAANRTAPPARSPSLVEAVRHKGAELLGRSKTSGLLLLTDLRKLYLAAQANELAWVTEAGRRGDDRTILPLRTTESVERGYRSGQGALASRRGPFGEEEGGVVAGGAVAVSRDGVRQPA